MFLYGHGASIIFYLFCVYLWGAVDVGVHVYGYQRTTCESLLSPSAVGSRLELR